MSKFILHLAKWLVGRFCVGYHVSKNPAKKKKAVAL